MSEAGPATEILPRTRVLCFDTQLHAEQKLDILFRSQ